MAWKGNGIVTALCFYVQLPPALPYCKWGTKVTEKGVFLFSVENCYRNRRISRPTHFAVAVWGEQLAGRFFSWQKKQKTFSSRLEAFLNRFVPFSNIDRHTLGNGKKVCLTGNFYLERIVASFNLK